MNSEDFYNMAKEYLAGIEKNTRQINTILITAKNTIIATAIGWLIFCVLKHLF